MPWSACNLSSWLAKYEKICCGKLRSLKRQNSKHNQSEMNHENLNIKNAKKHAHEEAPDSSQ